MGENLNFIFIVFIYLCVYVRVCVLQKAADCRRALWKVLHGRA